RVPLTEGARLRGGVELPVGEELVEGAPALDPAGVHRLETARRPDEQRLVVVAAEHVEAVRRGDRDLRLLLGGSQDRLDREAELLRRLLRDLRDRELHAQAQDAERAG